MVCVGLFQSWNAHEHGAQFFRLVAPCAPFFDTPDIGRQRIEGRAHSLEPDSPDRLGLRRIQLVAPLRGLHADDFYSIPFYGLLRLVSFVGCADLYQSSVSQRVF